MLVEVAQLWEVFVGCSGGVFGAESSNNFFTGGDDAVRRRQEPEGRSNVPVGALFLNTSGKGVHICIGGSSGVIPCGCIRERGWVGRFGEGTSEHEREEAPPRNRSALLKGRCYGTGEV